MPTPVNPARPAFTLTNPAGLYDPAPNGYSHVALLQPGARLVFIAGQGGENAPASSLKPSGSASLAASTPPAFLTSWRSG